MSGNSILQPALQELVPSPPQTHCYVLTVSLGVTSVTSSGEQVTFSITLPNWSLQEALAVSIPKISYVNHLMFLFNMLKAILLYRTEKVFLGK